MALSAGSLNGRTIVANRTANGKPFLRFGGLKQGLEGYNSRGMIHLHITQSWEPGLISRPDLGGKRYSPELAISWMRRREEFLSSVLALLRGPVPPKEFLGDPYFRNCWIEQRSPRMAFIVAVACQALLVLFPPPIWNTPPAHAESFASQMELTWYGPAKDFPAILPAPRAPKAAPRSDVLKTSPHRGADAFHPRQTILSQPLHPTHPRQTLIQPAAPPEPPKILPQLPNIVRLAGSEPARPKLQLSREQLAAMRPKAPAAHLAQDAAAPEMSTLEKQVGEINIASSAQAPLKPALPVSPMSAPRVARQRDDTNVAAPELAQQPAGDANTLIALSATPALVAPPPSVPAGNLSARVSISPEGSQPGVPAAASDGMGPNGGSAAGVGSHRPEGIFISGGNNATPEPAPGLGIGSTSRRAGGSLPSRPAPRVSISPRDSNAPLHDSGSAQESSKLDVLPEKVLGSKRIYTLHVNMPNLTSMSGSWVLNFAELDEMDAGPYLRSAGSDLAGPVALRKVDPKYPPELRTAHVEGEVILYGIIRKDGTVDSIQLVHGVDSHLDANAMEALAQWKFQPAEKRGEAIDIEAVVHIPFRSRAPQF
jgi:TonB family protein